MSRRNGRKQLAADVKPNMSVLPPRNDQLQSLPARPASVSPRSCVSFESDEMLAYPSSPEVTAMVLVGCPRCLMYVMLSDSVDKCPKCKSTLLLEFPHGNDDAATNSRDTATNRRNNQRNNL